MHFKTVIFQRNNLICSVEILCWTGAVAVAIGYLLIVSCYTVFS